jgi:hypothetical protein
VADLWQLLDEPGPELLGFIGRGLTGKDRIAMTSHLDAAMRIGAKVETPGGVPVTSEIQRADRVTGFVTDVCDRGCPWLAGTAAGRREREHRLPTGEQNRASNSTAASPQQPRVDAAHLGLDPA